MSPGPATLRVACATDERFAPHCGTMLRSLLRQQAPGTVEVSVLHRGDLAADTRGKLARVVEGAGASLRWLAVGPDRLRGFPTARFHVACWYRILLPELLPDTERILYLDADMLVLDDVASLWRTALDGRLFAAVVNPLYPFMPDRVRMLGLARPQEYLNSGVLLMDLARMRDARLVDQLRAYAGRHPNNSWPEQDALSVVCRGAWQAVPPRWNAQNTLFDLPLRQLPFPAPEVAEARARPAIVHFIGPQKPWHYLCRHPLRRRYAEFRRGTPWPEFELEGRTLRNRLLRPFSLGAQVRLQEVYRAVVGRWRALRLRGPRVMRAFARLYPRATFLQLGSNDGAKHDPLRAALLRSHWTGVMVEPVPYVFERLRANYGNDPRVRLENVAVAAQSGSLPFHYLAQSGSGDALPDWYDELGSFRKDVVLKHLAHLPDLEQRLISTEIPCVTVADLCQRNGLAAIDLLHMDLEGYDYELIKSIDFARVRPLLLVYEHKHLDPADQLRCREDLRRAGYAGFAEVADTWCIDTRERDARHRRFLRSWRRIAGAAA
jgi:FkbM family methyltransferase